MSFKFLDHLMKLKPKIAQIFVDLDEWSDIENIVDIEKINKISNSIKIELFIYDSVLSHNKAFPFSQFESNSPASDGAKISKGKKEALQIIIKIFLMHGITSLTVSLKSKNHFKNL